jgi:hypothetical protein
LPFKGWRINNLSVVEYGLGGKNVLVEGAANAPRVLFGRQIGGRNNILDA